jgi:hypothetical protein
LFAEVTEAVAEGVRQGLTKQAEVPASAETQEGEDMAEANQAELAELQAKLKAQEEALAKLQADKDAAEGEAKASSERIAKLEADARRKEFTAEVKGHTSGVVWIGDHDKHINHLERLSQAFGADSEEVKFYTEQNRAHAKQISESELFREIGSDREKESNSALAEINAEANKLMAADEKLTFHQAFDRVLQLNTSLYDRYLSEQKGRVN